MKKLPKKLFIAIKEEGTENEFFSCSTDLDDVVDFGETTKVGIYELTEVKTAANKSEFVVDEKKKRKTGNK